MTSKDQRNSIMNCSDGISRTGLVMTLSEGMEYLIITTTDDKGNKSVGGGMMKRQNSQQQGMTNYIDVKSVQEYSAKVEQLGGKVMIPKKPVPGMGYFAVCLDTENNTYAIWETDANAK